MGKDLKENWVLSYFKKPMDYVHYTTILLLFLFYFFIKKNFMVLKKKDDWQWCGVLLLCFVYLSSSFYHIIFLSRCGVVVCTQKRSQGRL